VLLSLECGGSNDPFFQSVMSCRLPSSSNKTKLDALPSPGVNPLECRNPTLAKCGVKPNTSKVGDLESSRTPECLEFNNKAQNTLH